MLQGNIDKYKLIETKGSGTFGTVWLAEDTWIGKRVALKIPHNQKEDFLKLYALANSRCRGRTVSPFITAGEVSAAILTDSGNTYVGVCIDTACTLGMCAERNAIAHMNTAGESRITKLVCCFENGRLGTPCGARR